MAITDKVKRVSRLENRFKAIIDDVQITDEMITDALIFLYGDKRPKQEVCSMVTSGCYSPPVNQLPPSTIAGDAGERYRRMCR